MEVYGLRVPITRDQSFTSHYLQVRINNNNYELDNNEIVLLDTFP
jgi:hypothetical protein